MGEWGGGTCGCIGVVVDVGGDLCMLGTGVSVMTEGLRVCGGRGGGGCYNDGPKSVSVITRGLMGGGGGRGGGGVL